MPRITRFTIIRIAKILIVAAVLITGSYQSNQLRYEQSAPEGGIRQPLSGSAASVALQNLEIKGRAPKTGYSRAEFSASWGTINNCDVRNYVLARDLSQIKLEPQSCLVASGTLIDPYTAQSILFLRGPSTSELVQIDHVVALSDAWQKGAQSLSPYDRYRFANDPLNLLAVQGAANQAKGDSDAASWLPSNKQYRCTYIARQIAVKSKYGLWVTQAEYDAMAKILRDCPDEPLPN